MVSCELHSDWLRPYSFLFFFMSIILFCVLSQIVSFFLLCSPSLLSAGYPIFLVFLSFFFFAALRFPNGSVYMSRSQRHLTCYFKAGGFRLFLSLLNLTQRLHSFASRHLAPCAYKTTSIPLKRTPLSSLHRQTTMANAYINYKDTSHAFSRSLRRARRDNRSQYTLPTHVYRLLCTPRSNLKDTHVASTFYCVIF